VEECKGKVVRVICTEPQFQQNDAETLLRDVTSKLAGQPAPHLAELDPLETADPAALDEGWHGARMRPNIASLAKASKAVGPKRAVRRFPARAAGRGNTSPAACGAAGSRPASQPSRGRAGRRTPQTSPARRPRPARPGPRLRRRMPRRRWRGGRS